MDNMWSFSSMAFVMGMRAKTQGTVVALVNKAMEGPRALQDSVLFQHELPTLGVAAWGLGFWAPQVLVLDLQGTCNQTSPALRKQLFARLTSWWQKKQELRWSAANFARRSRLEWRCVDCPPPCRLDLNLARHVSQLVEAVWRWGGGGGFHGNVEPCLVVRSSNGAPKGPTASNSSSHGWSGFG